MELVKIGTWNLCLGLPNKKELILETLKKNKIDVCCLQETELGHNFPEEILNSSDYCFEAENSTNKKRVGIYVHKRLNYQRRFELEEKNRHLIIIDLELDINIRIITLYRSFRPPDNLSPADFFRRQLFIANKHTINKTIL